MDISQILKPWSISKMGIAIYAFVKRVWELQTLAYGEEYTDDTKTLVVIQYKHMVFFDSCS